MRYKILLFGGELDQNHPFALAGDFFEKLTDVNFVYFMYPITILQRSGSFPGKSTATILNNKIELFERSKARVQGFSGY